MRIACLLVPDLPLYAELRACEALRGRPLAIASGTDPGAEVVAASAEARAAGVLPYTSIPRARSRCPGLAVRVASPALEQAARGALIDLALAFSPRVTAAPRAAGAFAAAAAVHLDASGVTSLFRSEAGFAAELEARSTEQGLPGVVAVAGSKDVSLLLARTRARDPRKESSLPPGAEAAFLADLSLDWFEPGEPLASRLTRFGLQRVRDLLALPGRGLAERLGPEILALRKRARGEAPESPLPEWREPRLEEGIDLEFAVDRIEPLLFVLRGVLSRLLERLRSRGRVVGSLDCQLGFAGGRRVERCIRVAAPTDDERVLLRLLALWLESQPPEDPVEFVALASEGVPERGEQLDLFLPRGPDPAGLDRTLAELEALCGAERVGAPNDPDGHRPDRCGLQPFDPPPASSDSRTREGAPPRSGLGGLRALRPPLTAEVQVQRGRPHFLRCAVACGPLVAVAGPWRISGHWWNEHERFAFDYFDVQVEDTSLLRLRFDWREKRWQVDGLYD
ncbi:MAG: hypothetical protein VCC68_08115 [Myxococcota bacterium]